MSERDFLVYCALRDGQSAAELFGPNRLFDVAINDYGESPVRHPRAEWYFEERMQKFRGAATNLPKITRPYAFYAFLDDDLEIDTEAMNRLFLSGRKYGLDLFQPSLTRGSFHSYPHTLQRPTRCVREAPFVEMMSPVFSRTALQKVLPTFSENLSGWGLDLYAWPKLLEDSRICIVDEVAARHGRPIKRQAHKQANGLSPWEEAELIRRKYRPEADRFHPRTAKHYLSTFRQAIASIWRGTGRPGDLWRRLPRR